MKDFLVLNSTKNIWDYVTKWLRAATFIAPKPDDDETTVLHLLKARNLLLASKNEHALIVHSYLWELAKLWQGWTYFDFSIPDYNEAYSYLCSVWGVEEVDSATRSYIVTCGMNPGIFLEKAQEEIGYYSLQWMEMFKELKDLVNGED